MKSRRVSGRQADPVGRLDPRLRGDDEIDGVEETTADWADAASRDRDRQMRLARAGPPTRTTLRCWAMNSPLARSRTKILVDRRAFELEVVDILGERQLGDRELISDRTRVLLRYLRLEQIADEPLRLCWRSSAVALISS